jgi:hypothetical protein
MKRFCFLFVAILFTIFTTFKITAQQDVLEDNYLIVLDDLKPLIDLLIVKGFTIKFEIPPKKGVYGLFQSKSKTLWISPITFELGIGRQTILHEATHAAQSCPYGKLTPVGFVFSTSPFIRNEIQANLIKNYDSNQYMIEKEAFSLQGSKNGLDLLLKALNERCNNL